MIKQLAAINPYYNFDDGWQVADVNIILGNIPIIGTDIIDKGEQSWDDPNPECQNIYEFLRWFFKRVQADGLLLPTKNGKPDYSLSREYYSKKKFLANISGNNKTNVPYSSKDYNFGYSDMSVQEAVCGLMVLMQSMSSETMNELMNVVMSGADGMLSDLLSFDGGKIALAVGNLLLPQFWGLLPMSIINIFSDLLNLYDNLINDWDVHSDSKRADTINNLMHDLLDKRKGMTKTVWDVLKPAEAKIVAEGIPVVLYFALNYASHDYNDTSDDDGMWGVGTFINNMDSIVANHYQEVSVAWVRSYDSFYANDTQAYKIDKKSVTAPTASYDMKTKKLTMYAEEGSSVFYTTDEGKTWNLYTEALDYETKPEGIKMFSISRGVKSTVVGISSNNAVGAFIGNGGYWFIIIGVLVIAGAVVAAVIIVKKKKNM